ncbi:zinc finger protein 34-like isoform X2 [Ambystoma mexicanum]|uniref:zinc finger protein 34-like isoform X2 n=1 Tax=Ambystoma mexicanum TaxID=8296 RepID=UPI0037E8569C
MSQRGPHKAPVTFYDVAACFSEEEWQLLHQWQKELYRNVMNTIQQTLVSLGPLIAASVFSLSATEKDHLRPLDREAFERRPSSSRSPRCVSINAERILELEEESTGRLIDHLGAEVDESSASLSSENVTVPPISIVIKEEEDDYDIDHPPLERQDDFSPHTGDESMVRDQEISYSSICTEKTMMRNEMSQKPKLKVHKTLEKITSTRSHLWPESGFKDPANSNSQKGTLKEEQSDKSDNFASNLWNESLPFCQPNTRYAGSNVTMNENLTRHYHCNECEKSFRQKASLIEHQRAHTGQRPFKCTECGKGFSRKRSLIVHWRIHMRERGHQCTKCDKNFSHNRLLIAHQRTHTGTILYQCTECEKSFRQNASLIEHQRTHTGQRPYHCNVCDKNFSRKRSLIMHCKIHIRETGKDTGIPHPE